MSLLTKEGSKKVDLTKASIAAGNVNGINRIYAGLEWSTDEKIDLDIMAVICDEDGNALNGTISSVAFFKTPGRKTGILEISPDNRDGDDAPEPNKFGFTDDEFLAIIGDWPEGAHHIDLLLCVYNFDENGNPTDFTFGDCDDAFARIVDLDTGKELEKLILDTSASDATNIVFGYFTKKGESLVWKKCAEEIDGNLHDVLLTYGLEID